MNAAVRCAIACAIAFLVPLAAADGLVKPTRRVAIIDTAHLRAYVPHAQAEALKPLVARADVIYQALARDAGYVITGRLHLLISDDFDDHNGFSTVVPYALVQVELAPPPPQSGIFDGHDHVERTLVHEFTHHIANDRNPVGFRRVLERIFGRVLPNDLLSLLVFYLSTPAHITQPPFWQEGLAQWAETTYAPEGPWSGRGRDSLAHMVWRLDAARSPLAQVGAARADLRELADVRLPSLAAIAAARDLKATVAAWQACADVWARHRAAIAAADARGAERVDDAMADLDEAIVADHARHHDDVVERVRAARGALDRLAASGIPHHRDWRLSYTRWPFGNRAYIYGLAYLRYLDAAYADEADAWRMIDAQSRQWPFRFTTGLDNLAPEAATGARPLAGKDHGDLLAEARAALMDEQVAQIAALQAKPITRARRLTEPDFLIGAPAWTVDGRLIAAHDGRYERPTYQIVDAEGDRDQTWMPAWAVNEIRSTPDGARIYADTPVGTNPWARSRVYLVQPDGQHSALDGSRLTQPDLRVDGDRRWSVAAVQLRPAGRQRLVVTTVTGERSAWDLPWSGPDQEDWREVPTEGRAWTPAWRPGHDTLCWVETHPQGSRLVLAPLSDPGARTVLLDLAGRILHPCWSADGARLYLCADHSGVCNAYVLDPAAPGRLTAITNTLGGVVACVPSFDGKELALKDYDHRGPFLARIANDPATFAGEIPSIALAWPAPLGSRGDLAAGDAPTPPTPDGPAPQPQAAPAERAAPQPRRDGRRPLPLDPGPQDLTARNYWGLANIRPLFWTPTTVPVADGGLGVIGVAADPLLTHEVIASIGVGPVEAEVVGSFGYIFSGWPIDLGLFAWRSERTFADLVTATPDEEFDYTETVAVAEVRVGSGMSGMRRRWQAYVAGGLADYEQVDDSVDEYAGLTLTSAAPFTGEETYGEAVVAYDDATFFPTSYAREDGTSLVASYRRSRFEGDDDGRFDRDRLLALGTAVVAVWPSMGHQVVAGGAIGVSNGDETLQGAFSVGGALGVGLPRGYVDREATGTHIIGYSLAYRAALWRHFRGFGSSPLVHRQIVLEGFFDAAKVSDDRPNGDGEWYRSAGGELHDSFEFWLLLFNPGIGVAQQLDGDEDTTVYITLDFRL